MQQCDRVVIINDFSLARGGATALALMSARLLRERGIPVTLFCGDTPDNPDLAEWGVEVVPVGGKPLLEQGKVAAFSSGLWNRAAKSKLADLVETRDTLGTIYHVHAWSLILSPSIFAALRPVAHRVVIHSHDQFLACPNGAFFDFQKGVSCSRTPLGVSCLMTHCDKRSYVHKGWRVTRQAVLARVLNDKTSWGGIVLIHPKLEVRLKSFGYAQSTMITIRNPVDPFAERRVAAENNDRFFYVGRVEPDKGVLELAEAARRADVPLTVVGDGPLLDHLQAEYPEISLPGWCTKDEIGQLMAQARGLVMPSRFAEPFGLVAVEAIQSGVPAIVAQDAFLADEITQNGLGLACNIHDTEDFAQALRAMADLPTAEVARMSTLGYENRKSLALTPDAWCDALLDLYRSLLDAPLGLAAE